MQAWMTLWIVMLVGSVATFAGLLVYVGTGAWRELSESLAELRKDTRDAAEHPEVLDREI